MCVCLFLCVSVCLFLCMCICMCMYLFMCVCLCLCVWMFLCLCLCVCRYLCVCVCLFLCVCVCLCMLNHLLCEWPHSSSLQNSKHKSHTALQIKCPQRNLAESTWKQQLVSGVVSLMILCKESPDGRGVKKSLGHKWDYSTNTHLSLQKPAIIASCLRKEYAGKKKKCFSKTKKKIATRNVSFCVKKGWEPQFCQ